MKRSVSSAPNGSGREGADVDAGTPKAARALVAGLFVALLVPGLIGFDLWPLTGWRMFSLPRADERTTWVLQATDAEGETRIVSLEELPFPYRHAEWRLRGVRRGSEDFREELCRTMGVAVAEVDPEAVELSLALDEQRLVQTGDGWGIRHDPEIYHSCDLEVLR